MLLDERDAVEGRARDGHLEVVTAAGAVEHVDLPAREGCLEQRADRVGGHRHDANDRAAGRPGPSSGRSLGRCGTTSQSWRRERPA